MLLLRHYVWRPIFLAPCARLTDDAFYPLPPPCALSGDHPEHLLPPHSVGSASGRSGWPPSPIQQGNPSHTVKEAIEKGDSLDRAHDDDDGRSVEEKKEKEEQEKEEEEEEGIEEIFLTPLSLAQPSVISLELLVSPNFVEGYTLWGEYLPLPLVVELLVRFSLLSAQHFPILLTVKKKVAYGM